MQNKEYKRYILQVNKTKSDFEDNLILLDIQKRLKQVRKILDQNAEDFKKLKIVKKTIQYNSEDYNRADKLLTKVLESKNIDKLFFYSHRYIYLMDIKIAIANYLRNKNYTLELIGGVLKCSHATVLNLLSKDLKYYPEVVKIIDEIDKINQEANNE